MYKCFKMWEEDENKELTRCAPNFTVHIYTSSSRTEVEILEQWKYIIFREEKKTPVEAIDSFPHIQKEIKK